MRNVKQDRWVTIKFSDGQTMRVTERDIERYRALYGELKSEVIYEEEGRR